MSVIHAPPKREIDLREVLPLALVVAALTVMFVRLWYLQVVRGEELSERARNLRTSSISKLAPRGLIFDRNGVVLAGIKPEIVVTARPAEIKRNPWVLDKVASMIGQPVEKLRDIVEKESWRPHIPAPIYVGLPIEIAGRIVESADNLPGIGVEWQPMRVYSDTKSLCHILGYVWTPADRDVDRLKELGIKPADYVGKDGLERVYESALMGAPGSEILEFDSRRRPLRVIGRDNPVPGDRLVLGMDLKLQRIAQRLLTGKRGAVVALEPKTGEVLCLVSSPGFDTALFEKGISTKDWNLLQNDDGHPLLNRAAGSRYAPGSTFKIVVSLAAMKAGKWSLTHPNFCPGYITVGRSRPKCLGTHGSIAYHSAFARSCNTYFADLARRVGEDDVRNMALQVGIGRKTGIDLPSENPGLVPTQEWLDSRKPPLKWYPGDTVNLGIGQGYLAATPLQMASVVSLVANEGISYKPHIVRSKIPPGSDGKPIPEPREVLGKVDLPANCWRELKSAMVEVIQSGTARVAQIPGVVWGGKTGSAEHRTNALTHSWFVGVAPMDDPQIAICVVVEAAGHGSTVAAPIARDVVRAYLTEKQGPPTDLADVIGDLP